MYSFICLTSSACRRVLAAHRGLCSHIRHVSGPGIGTVTDVRRGHPRRQPRPLPNAVTRSSSLSTSATCYASSVSPKAITLRPYQEECLTAVQAALRRGVSRLGVSSPTGSGKTTIFGELITRIAAPSPTQHRVLILVSSVQLALQTAAHIVERYPNLWVEIEQGQKYQAGGHADVTVATWQTLVSAQSQGGMEHMRLEKFDPSTTKAVIVDEAHHAASRSWRLVLNHFDGRVKLDNDVGAASPSVPRATSTVPPPIIGFSATFSRHDGLSLGSVFEEIVFHRDVLDLIDEKWLSPLRFTSIQAQVPLDSVSISGKNGGADFNSTSLARVINTEPINRLIVRSWLAKARGHSGADAERSCAPSDVPRTRTLVFAVNIQHVHDLMQAFRSSGIDARSLTSSTSMPERKQLLQDFADGQYPVLVNCAILTEGADIPSIDCVLLARPTLSRNLFSQMIGRGMRLSPSTDKEDCLILDLVGNCSKGLVCSPTLFGLDPTEVVDDMETAQMLERRKEKEESDRLNNKEATEGAGWRNPFLEQAVQDPTRVTFVDWDSAKALHQAMSAKALFSASVERYSSNAWVDCGDDVYVIDIPPNRGYVRVERADAEDPDVEESKDAGTRDATDYMPDVQQRAQGGSWVAYYIARIADQDEAIAASAGRWRGKLRSPYRRPRKFLEADTLEQAIRGSDTYVATHILRSSGLMRAIMSRFAPWRSALASSRQQAFVEKRLGLQPGESSVSRDGMDDQLQAKTNRLQGMTKGEASIILTRLHHGAKRRWQREIKRHNKQTQRQTMIEQRRQRETVQVGRLEV